MLITNSISNFIIPIFIKAERHTTKSGEQNITTVILLIASVLNSIIMPLVSFFGYRILYGSLNHDNMMEQIADFLPRIVSNWITLAFYPPILNLLHIGYLWELLKLKIIHCMPIILYYPQKEINKMYECQPFGYQGAYIKNITLLYYTILYFMLLPIGVLISAIGVALSYWVDKYYVITKRKSEYHKKKDNFVNIVSAAILYGWIPFMVASVFGTSFLKLATIRDNLQFLIYIGGAAVIIVVYILYRLCSSTKPNEIIGVEENSVDLNEYVQRNPYNEMSHLLLEAEKVLGA